MSNKVVINLTTGMEDPERVLIALLVGHAATAQGKEVAAAGRSCCCEPCIHLAIEAVGAVDDERRFAWRLAGACTVDLTLPVGHEKSATPLGSEWSSRRWGVVHSKYSTTLGGVE